MGKSIVNQSGDESNIGSSKASTAGAATPFLKSGLGTHVEQSGLGTNLEET